MRRPTETETPDERLRRLERKWKSTGAIEDGEAWVIEKSRQKPADLTRMLSMLIQLGRAVEAIGTLVSVGDLAINVKDAISQRVTPDDMVRWLDGSHDLGLKTRNTFGPSWR